MTLHDPFDRPVSPAAPAPSTATSSTAPSAAETEVERWDLRLPEPVAVPAEPVVIERTTEVVDDATAGAGMQTASRFRPAEFDPAVLTPSPDPVATAAPVAAATPGKQGWSPAFARAGEELVAWFKTLVSAGVYATLIVTFGFQVARVEGQSMVPTLEDQDRLIVNKFAYRIGIPQVGDIVMLYYPRDPDKSFVKRVIGEPGDTLRSVNGRVYRNEVPFADDFIPEEFRTPGENWGPETVEEGHYFVMGDHRNNSSDSRTWGQVPAKYIIGKVQLRWWPLNHARIF